MLFQPFGTSFLATHKNVPKQKMWTKVDTSLHNYARVLELSLRRKKQEKTVHKLREKMDGRQKKV